MTEHANENGYSLMEVMIAMAIFAVGILGIASMQTQATNSITVARVSTELSHFAYDQMEKISQVPFSDLPSGNASLSPDDISQITGVAFAEDKDSKLTSTTTDGAYSVNCDVNEDSIFDDTKTVTLTVRAFRRENFKGGNTRTLVLQNIIPRR